MPAKPLSKTAAKRQAHRESSMHRQPGAGWTVTATSEPAKAYTLGHGLSFSGARRELAAWRAARVRELIGEPEVMHCTCGGHERNRDIHREHCPLFADPSKAPWHQASKTSVAPAPGEARGDSSPRGEKGGSGR